MRLALLFWVCTIGCRGSPDRCLAAPADEVRVLQAFLETVKPRYIVRAELAMRTPDSHAYELLASHGGPMAADLHDKFRTSTCLPGALSPSRVDVLVSTDVQALLEAPPQLDGGRSTPYDAWAHFHAVRPDVAGLMHFSRVGFDGTHARALVYHCWIIDPLYGGCDWVEMHAQGNGWRLAGRTTVTAY